MDPIFSMVKIWRNSLPQTKKDYLATFKTERWILQ